MPKHRNNETTNRLSSLDILRGLTVAGMILVNNGYGESFATLRHSRWNGLTVCDLVFPFFLFIVGVSCYLSLRKTGFRATRTVLTKVVRRTVLLFALGLALNWLDHAIEGDLLCLGHLRLWAVLQRIALCYLLATMAVLTLSHRRLPWLVVGLLAAYTLLLYIGNGYAEDASTNILAQADLRLFGYDHLYHKSPVDPEGLLGIIPSTAHVLIGFLCGRLIAGADRTPREKANRLLVAGTALAVAGLAVSTVLPLNKRIWSPSYALLTCGLAALLLGLLTYAADGPRGRQWQRALRPFTIFGVNALALYILSEVLSIVFGHFGINTLIYDAIVTVVAPPKLASLGYALCFVAINYAAGYVLWRRRIFIKL